MNFVKQVYIVGEKYKKLLIGSNIFSLQFLENQIKFSCEEDHFTYNIYFGQGNNLAEVSDLMKYVKENKLEYKYVFANGHIQEKCSKLLTHKYLEENVIISEPYKHEDDYMAYLILDERCLEISDHITGQHIQGMLLIEAARQMTIAITEKFYIDSKTQRKLSFSTKMLEVRFINFIFPFEVVFVCKINKIRGFGDNKEFDFSISILQNGSVGVEIRYVFCLFNKAYLENRQNDGVNEIINSTFSIKRVDFK